MCPAVFAHGFQTLHDNTEVFYQMSEYYYPEYSGEDSRWDDPAFGIKWPLPCSCISQKDRSYKNLVIEKRGIYMDKITGFEMEKKKNIDAMDKDSELKKLSYDWFVSGYKYKYSYNFTWLGRPIIQYPQDIAAMQEIIWSVKPDLIIETGIAHGGSLIFYASMLELIGGEGEVLGIDIDIRQHNRTEIEKHKMYKEDHHDRRFIG